MKTFKYFLEQAPDQEPATDATEKENSVSNLLKSKENRQKMIKKQVLLKKLQAVRAGAHKGIVAHYEPEGEMVEGWLTKKKPEKKAEKAMDAGARARRKVERRVYADRISGSEDLVPDSIRENMNDPQQDQQNNTEKETAISNQLKSKENRQKMIKKQVLLKKLQAVRAGGHKGIVAHYEPEGEVISENKRISFEDFRKK